MSGNLKQALPGDMLLVIHEFVARSPDELSLAKGDRIELIERDDDFGDGWFLGRHLQNGATGLFPEVYTTPAPKSTLPGTNALPAPSAQYSNTTLSSPVNVRNAVGVGLSSSITPAYSVEKPPVAPPAVNVLGSAFTTPGPSPQIGQMPVTQSSSTYMEPPSSTFINRDTSQNSTVINDTLNVIDEHITNMNRPSLSVVGGNDRRPSNDSGSQYSNSFGRRPSYVNGEDVDEDLFGLTPREVMGWSPAKVAEYLEKAGVEKSHCDVFQEEEFSGEVILGLDQSAILLQELRLGSIGRRMKTWQKIRALQDEVKNASSTQKRPTTIPPSAASPSLGMYREASPRTLLTEQPSADALNNLGNRFQIPQQPERREFIPPTFPSPVLGQSSPRPSAASVRDLAHSRRQSSVDASSIAPSKSPYIPDYSSHIKQGSFDRSWTMQSRQASTDPSWNPNARRPPSQGVSRPVSTAHLHSISADRSQFDRPVSSFTEPDRGYSSGGELDMKKQRAPLQNRESGEPGKVFGRAPEPARSSPLFARGSRPPSPEKKFGSGAPTQMQSSIRIVSEPVNGTSPTVTKLEYGSGTPRGDRVLESQVGLTESPTADNTQAPNEGFGRKGFRAISDAITGREKANAQNPAVAMDSSPQTPTLGGSSTPSITSRSIDLEDANKSEFSTPAQSQTTATARRKSKKSTSAYIRGLEKKTYQEQIVGCDYSGWMKKKSSNLMTTWKPRLFVLRGRRLSYYYSENDKEEKGLIDISNHRVLPADTDVITGLHATLTGATSSNTTPPMSGASPMSNNVSKSAIGTPSSASGDSPTAPSLNRANTAFSFTSRDSASPLFKGDAQSFIFKLVPPRTGLSKAVNFTKPTVHYFAVPSLHEGRMWMAALMKATIDRDESKKVITTYQQKTISLEKARARRERPPGLRDVNEAAEDDGEEDEEDTAAGAQEEDVLIDRENGNDNGVGDAADHDVELRLGSSGGARQGAERERERQEAPRGQHASNPSQSMSFVTSLERQADETSASTPSTAGGGDGGSGSGSGSGRFRKWSFGSSRRGSTTRSEQAHATAVAAAVAATGSASGSADPGAGNGLATGNGQGLGIHGVRDGGAW